MARKAWLVLSVVVVVAASAVPALAESSTHVRVSPGSGGKKSSFGVHFQAPQSVGSGSTSSEYIISASSRSGKHSCVSSTSATVPSAQQGAMVDVTLKPGAGNKWCVGKFQGEVKELIRPVCGCPQPVASRNIACPMTQARASICMQAQFIGLEPVATFSFRVHGKRPAHKHAPHKHAPHTGAVVIGY